MFILFLILHFGIASLGFAPARYEAVSSALRRLSAGIPVIDGGLVLLVVVQTAIGIRLLARSGLGYHSSRCKDDGRLRYFLQRWSGVLILLFIAMHLAMFKLWPCGPSFIAASRRFTMGHNPLLIAFCIPVLAGLAFHAGNGLWTGASVWGARESHPRLWLRLSVACGAMVATLGFAALWAFAK